MILAIRLLGGTALLCLLCCAVPATSLFPAGVLELGARKWGIAGGIGLLIGAAGLVVLTSRRRALIETGSCHCPPAGAGNLPETPAPPIACTLTLGDYQHRVKSIRELAARSLVSANRTTLALHLVYQRDAREAVQELVHEERSCCAFLIFELDDNHTDGLRLTITTPAEAGPAADVLLAHFDPELTHKTTNQGPSR